VKDVTGQGMTNLKFQFSTFKYTTMNILSRLFGRKFDSANGSNLNTSTEPVEVQEMNIPKELFIESNPPEPKQIVDQRESKIAQFLNRNFRSMGTMDGFEYHSQDTLLHGKKKIRTEFLLIIDQEIDTLRQKRLKLKTLVISVLGISNDTRQNLELAIDEVDKSIDLLEKQKVLSVDDEGWVMNAIYNYHLGFIQGLNDYIEGEQLLHSNNII
jgi:hypothetical protein